MIKIAFSDGNRAEKGFVKRKEAENELKSKKGNISEM